MERWAVKSTRRPRKNCKAQSNTLSPDIPLGDLAISVAHCSNYFFPINSFVSRKHPFSLFVSTYFNALNCAKPEDAKLSVGKALNRPNTRTLIPMPLQFPPRSTRPMTVTLHRTNPNTTPTHSHSHHRSPSSFPFFVPTSHASFSQCSSHTIPHHTFKIQ